MRQCNVAEIPEHVTNFDWRLGVRSAPEKPHHILIGFQKNEMVIKRRIHLYWVMSMIHKLMLYSTILDTLLEML